MYDLWELLAIRPENKFRSSNTKATLYSVNFRSDMQLHTCVNGGPGDWRTLFRTLHLGKGSLDHLAPRLADHTPFSLAENFDYLHMKPATNL